MEVVVVGSGEALLWFRLLLLPFVMAFWEGVILEGKELAFLVLMVSVLVAERARPVVDVVDTPFAKADIDVAGPWNIACLLA